PSLSEPASADTRRDDMPQFEQGLAELQLLVRPDGEVAGVNDQTAQRARGTVAGDQRGERGIGALDDADVAEIGQLRTPPLDVRDQRAHRIGQVVLGPLGEEVDEPTEVAAVVEP
ncbi:hypothetical protein K7G98_35570, partial [Saccharothrix sp. MB29]|nr:hypothetical protein [Saccharothrix sp. MB29]